MGTKGVAAVTLTLGDSQFVWDVYVAPIGDDLLLGCDVLDEMDITVNSRKGIQLNGKWIECEVKRKSDLIARVVLDSNFTIPPSSEVILYGCGQNQELLDTRYSMIQPVIEDSRKFMVAQTLVDPFHEKYSTNSPRCVKTHELSKENFTLSETIEKANIQEKWESEIKICKINELNGKQKKKAENQLLPEHLKDLYERSSKDIESESIKEKLAEVLQKNSMAFASSKTVLGTCSLVKHRMNTAGLAPIRQPSRRTPAAFDNEDKKNLDEQLELEIIQPSKSAWASNVVLVRKKDNTVRWCLDFRKLNDLTIKNAYPLPRIDMCLDCLASASLFSCRDLQSGY
ncbi:Hypothetical predicted protein [Mytilus galloprovincialis]|uniref:Reverse transcriptase domain-containing protein n=1 Tax=Mytilus galloprovincialis TaxID=29158 RepID=A0A8B6CGM8_MYTGA|nr:Hypothetical predicted protein [Mytilus galloprovincialis]